MSLADHHQRSYFCRLIFCRADSTRAVSTSTRHEPVGWCETTLIARPPETGSAAGGSSVQTGAQTVRFRAEKPRVPHATTSLALVGCVRTQLHPTSRAHYAGFRPVRAPWLSALARSVITPVVGKVTANLAWDFRPHRLHADVARSVVSVSVCVGNTGELCKNGWTDRDAVWGKRKGNKEYLYSAIYILCISQSAQAWIT